MTIYHQMTLKSSENGYYSRMTGPHDPDYLMLKLAHAHSAHTGSNVDAAFLAVSLYFSLTST